MIGKTISHYKILEKLGSGSMGVVYKAEDTKLNRTVALKFLPANVVQDPVSQKRFIHEARAASALEHPNICTIFEIDEGGDGQAFISMSYCQGQTIKQKIEEGSLTTENVLSVLSQCISALQKAHQQGIIHRDINPANVILNDEGQVKILDFGLAKLVGQSRLTVSITTMGTIAYMSPEQARGEEVDHRTDIWSLGVMLFEILTGELPFKGHYDQAVIYSILNEEPPQIRALKADAPEDLARVVMRMLEKDPDSRYQQMSDIAHDLNLTDTGISTIKIKTKKSQRSFFHGGCHEHSNRYQSDLPAGNFLSAADDHSIGV